MIRSDGRFQAQAGASLFPAICVFNGLQQAFQGLRCSGVQPGRRGGLGDNIVRTIWNEASGAQQSNMQRQDSVLLDGVQLRGGKIDPGGETPQVLDGQETAVLEPFWGCLLYTSPSPRD